MFHSGDHGIVEHWSCIEALSGLILSQAIIVEPWGSPSSLQRITLHF